jgi:hypothetical protein
MVELKVGIRNLVTTASAPNHLPERSRAPEPGIYCDGKAPRFFLYPTNNLIAPNLQVQELWPGASEAIIYPGTVNRSSLRSSPLPRTAAH